MWAEVVTGVGAFPDAVLTGRDVDGCPFSVRWAPQVIAAEQVLRAPRAAGVELTDGPASLLGHSLDSGLGGLRSFLVRGTLRTLGDDWVFRPDTYVAGLGMSGPLADFRGFLDARRRASRYLQRRGLDRPRIPWPTIRQRR